MALSFSTDIRPLFTKKDLDHMNRRGVHLDDYAWMSRDESGQLGDCKEFSDHRNARSVYAFLTGACKPRMPMGEPFWEEDKLTTFKEWMEEGFQP
jgi:hypothetical protein